VSDKKDSANKANMRKLNAAKKRRDEVESVELVGECD